MNPTFPSFGSGNPTSTPTSSCETTVLPISGTFSGNNFANEPSSTFGGSGNAATIPNPVGLIFGGNSSLSGFAPAVFGTAGQLSGSNQHINAPNRVVASHEFDIQTVTTSNIGTPAVGNSPVFGANTPSFDINSFGSGMSPAATVVTSTSGVPLSMFQSSVASLPQHTTSSMFGGSPQMGAQLLRSSNPSELSSSTSLFSSGMSSVVGSQSVNSNTESAALHKFAKDNESNKFGKTIFGENSSGIAFGKTSSNMVFGGGAGSNVFGGSSAGNVFGGSLTKNVFGGSSAGNIFGGKLMASISNDGSDGILPAQSSSQDIDKSQLRKIIVAQVPVKYLDPNILRYHFAKFGTVERVSLKPDSHQAVILYSDCDGARLAKTNGKKLDPNLPEVKIFFAPPVQVKNIVNRLSEKASIAPIVKPTPERTKRSKWLSSSGESYQGDLDPYFPIERPAAATKQKNSAVPDKDEAKSHSGTSPLQAWSSMLKKSSIMASSRTKTAELKPKVMAKKTLSSKKSPLAPKPTVKLAAHAKSVANLGQTSASIATKVAVRAKVAEATIQNVSMSAALKTKADTPLDRLEVLKARDKLLRVKLTKSLSLATAKYLAATCPDMCPEKERYMRAAHLDLSPYEIPDGGSQGGEMDHRLIIKKFSRSSADKEEPLPHELRPGPVLLQTMDFLICNVIDKGEEPGTDLGIWYNYLWDRTRAVRNDQSTQHLLDTDAMSVMERCVRFHIHCCYRLCEESVEVFDPKMNNEHLAKSLQSLKELYQDLQNKGFVFTTESEFLAYEILLNLFGTDEASVIFLHSSCREDVRMSPEVRYATQVWHAATSNNVVAFFRLLQKATYLQACLLHRYFSQFRKNGLKLLFRCGDKGKKLSLQKVVSNLCFENENEAEMFLSYYEIPVLQGLVTIESNKVLENSNVSISSRRSYGQVEYKCNGCSVSKIIQGGPLPNNPLNYHIPHNSFDDDGYLKPEALSASDQHQTFEVTPIIAQVNVISIPTSDHPSAMFQGYHLHSWASEILDEVADEMACEVANSTYADTMNMVREQELSRVLLSELISGTLNSELKNVCSMAIHEVATEQLIALQKKREDEEQRRRIVQTIMNHCVKEVVRDNLDEANNSLCYEISLAAIQEVRWELWWEVCNEIEAELVPQLESEMLPTLMREISMTVISELNVELEHNVETLRNKRLLRLAGKFFNKWHYHGLKMRRLLQERESFPASFSYLNVEDQNAAFGWGYNRLLITNISTLELQNIENKNKCALANVSARLEHDHQLAWCPLPLENLFMTALNEALMKKKAITGNLLECFMDVAVFAMAGASNDLVTWIRCKFGGWNYQTKPLTNYVRFNSKMTTSQYNVCFREVQVLPDDLFHYSNLIILTSEQDNVQLSNLIQSMSVSYPYLQISCIILGQNRNRLSRCLSLDDINMPQSSEKLQTFIVSMWQERGLKLCMLESPLRDFVLNFVTNKVLHVAIGEQEDRASLHRSPLAPSAYVNFYNSAIDYLSSVLNDPELCEFEWPPIELPKLECPHVIWTGIEAAHWAKVLQASKLADILVCGSLTFSDLQAGLEHYSALIVNDTARLKLQSQLLSILSSTKKSLMNTYCIGYDEINKWKIPAEALPWLELIRVCIRHQMDKLPNVKVYYRSKLLNSFCLPFCWLNAVDSHDEEWADSFIRNMQPKNPKRKANSENNVEVLSKENKLRRTKFFEDLAHEKEKQKELQEKMESLADIEADVRWLFEQ